ncbi:MAG: hypothetical protein Q7K43_05310, partial [Candidatus Woesearchaeota archaeon]|nr:hypothetical protein [Candidatus Woesearchaeota archaeon]
DTVAVGMPAKIEIPFLALDIWQVDLLVQSSDSLVKNINNVYVNMTKRNLPQEYKALTGFYGAWMFNGTIGSSGIFSQINITYRVPYSWLDNQKLKANQISLYLYTNTSIVQELPAIHLQDYNSARGLFAKMQSTVPAFGLFVVAQKNKKLQEEIALELAENSTQNKTLENQTVGNQSFNQSNQLITNQSSNENQSIASDQTASCDEVWLCTDWTTCSTGTQTRQCTDKNNCSTTAYAPPKTQICFDAVITVKSALPAVSLPNTTSLLNKTTAIWGITKQKFTASFNKIPLAAIYAIAAVLAVLIALFVLKPCLKKLFSIVHYKKLDREFDRRVESLWKRRQGEEDEERQEQKKQKKNEFVTDYSEQNTSGRDLPGMPPRR